MSEPQLRPHRCFAACSLAAACSMPRAGSGWEPAGRVRQRQLRRRPGRQHRAPSTAASVAASSTAPSGGGEDQSDTDKSVNWSNWPEYIDVDDKTKKHPTLDAFTAATGIKVNYTEDVNDNDEFFAKIKPSWRPVGTPVATRSV